MVSSRQTTAVENDNNISLDLAPHLASGVLENTNESEKESDDSEAEEDIRGCPEEPEGDQWHAKADRENTKSCLQNQQC